MPDFTTSRAERESSAFAAGRACAMPRAGGGILGNKRCLAIKRGLDVVVGLLALALFSPLLLLAAVVIKLTSNGPVLFRQDRVGQHGKRFTFLKFRSMYANSDDSVHRDYVKALIKENAAAKPGNNGTSPVYKLTHDARITPIGRLLRRTSIDELPQLINVLKGDMSLVGPRPAVPYEVEHYSDWHRQRLVVKPGITGLWQVRGRSRVKFDEMVALDLEYAQSWSLALDMKILLLTPRVVIFGDGAY
jgi:exopolysaccharide biosynthesis polyprenyl glycosylphosphotransferase